MGWYEFKEWLEVSSGIDMDALHVYAGVAGLLLAALLLRRPLGSALPWLAVLIAELLNEGYDLLLETWPNRDTQWMESGKDVLNTMLLPTLLLLLARYAPRLFVGVSPPIGTPGETQP